MSLWTRTRTAIAATVGGRTEVRKGAADHAGFGVERERAHHVMAKAEPRHPARALI